jgi:hypothetical protein
MTDNPTPTTGENLEQLLERVLFEDEATHPLRDEWHQTQRTEQEVFERVCREEYERRLEYHQICQTPEPAETARRETNLCAILFKEKEELDARLMERWIDIQRRLRAVLESKKAAAEDKASAEDGGARPPADE